jgi:uroporphyrinogen decarboxylase
MIGRSVQEALQDAEVQLEALGALEEALRPDIIFTLLDLTVEAEALGLEVDFFENKPPNLAEQALPMLVDLVSREIPDPESSGRMPLFLQVAEGLSVGDERMSGAFATGPFTLLSQLLGLEELLERLRAGEDLEEAIGFTTAVVGEYAAALADRVDMLVVVDVAVEALETSEYRQFCRPYMRGLVGIIRASGAACMVHVCGDSSHLLEEMALAGVEGICVSSKVNLVREAEKLPMSLVLMGNIDAKRIIERGTAEDVNWEVRRLLRHMTGAPNFILSTGCDVSPDAPMENLEAMMEAARKWRPRAEMF